MNSTLQSVLDTLFLASRRLRLELEIALRGRQEIQREGKHLAVFAWALPPSSNAGVHRPLSLIRYGPHLGWRCTTFQGNTPENQQQHGEELVATIPAGTKMHVVPSSRREPSYRFSPQVDGGFKNAIANALYAIEAMKSDPPNVVLGSGPPFHVFISAYFVARFFRIPLILDYRDEWTECPFDFVTTGPDDRTWERRCLARAAAVIFTTSSHIEHQLEQFTELTRQKTYLVPNGWEPSDFSASHAEEVPVSDDRGKPVVLAHVGTLAGHNLPDAFLEALAELLASDDHWRKSLIVEFIGRRSPQANKALERFPYMANLRLFDHVGKREANRRMVDASILLLLAAPELNRYLPGKLFDYVAAQRPILCFGSRGESASLLEDLRVGAVCTPGSGIELGDVLKHLARLEFPSKDQSAQTWLDEHQRGHLARKVFKIISSVVDSAQ